jgi:ankyrin repeat protein
MNNLHDICNSHIKATPLHFACMQNNINGVRCILRRNANLNMTDYLGNTALHYATENGNLELLRLLCDYGADALKRNKEGLNSIQIAIHQNNREVKLFFLGLERYKNLQLKDYI